MSTDTALEMFVGGLVVDPLTQAPVVILRNEAGDKILPVWIGVAEATAIAAAIKQLNVGRPLTHDLMHSIFLELGVRVERIVITSLKGSTYFAEMVLLAGDKVMVLDTRPSDAIAIALRESAPIFVVEEVIESAKNTASELEKNRSKVTDSQSGTDKNNSDPTSSTDEGTSSQQGPDDLSNITKEQWKEILADLDPDDFKYKV
ncbi:MAG TPA: bifunctional nuclease family protein [Oligoflexia bacterium]|nr:bifunctional nuclease family protein [Oligoflexia bacterium]HMP27662.1 bifunctional nuclease family protein [Oligoflexia bacterium]